MVRKKLRTGVAWYIYAWRGGPQVFRSEGSTKPKLNVEIMKLVVDAQEKRAAPEEKTLRSLIRLWRSQNPSRPSSPEWERLADTTKKTWGSALDRIEEKWGDVPLVVFNDPRMKSRIVAWRDSRSDTPRAADIGVTVLHALLRFGLLRGKVVQNAAADIPSLYRGGQRAEIIWTEADLLRFHEHALLKGHVAASDGLRLAAATGLRRDDLVSLTWDHVHDFVIDKKAKKTSRGKRRYATVVRTQHLDDLLAELCDRPRSAGVDTVLVDGSGNAWTADRLSKAIAVVRDALSIVHIDEETGETRKKHLHDARGTFATRLMTLPGEALTDQQIANMMGWSPEQVGRIRHVYVDQRAVVVALAQRIGRGAVN